MRNKSHRIEVRISEAIFKKFIAICDVNGRAKTSMIESLIEGEYKRNAKYRDQYYINIDKK